jgi:CHRD domain
LEVARKTLHLWVGAVAVAAVLVAGSAVAALPIPSKGAGGGTGGGVPAVAIPLRANLSASQVGSLQVASTASGRFLGALIRRGFTGRGDRPNFSWGLFWVVSVQNTTGPVTGIEIRSGGISAAAAPVFLTLCGPCSLSASAASAGANYLTGKVTNLTQEQVTALRKADLYVNVSTAANPAGELRGPITRRTPAPSAAPPNNRIPNPIKPGPPQNIPG